MNRFNILTFTIFTILLTGCGGDSSGSPDSSPIDLTGTWVSNCYELRDADTDEFITHSKDTYIFYGDAYIREVISYDDSQCDTPSGNTDSEDGSYFIGSTVTASDGAPATVISMSISSSAWPEDVPSVEMEFAARVSGVNLNFGVYQEGEAPSIFYPITYIRQ